jgi:aminopeptidase 2
MLSNYVGEERFLKGVSLYLKKKLYANSVTHDLWEAISTATELDITHLMENWITKIGFPMLTVTEDAKGITVRQDRFLETGPADPKDNQTIWFILYSFFSPPFLDSPYRNIPLSLLSTNDGKPSVDLTAILQEREKTIPLDTSQPFKLNADTVGVCVSILNQASYFY